MQTRPADDKAASTGLTAYTESAVYSKLVVQATDCKEAGCITFVGESDVESHRSLQEYFC
jgi:hypothetical protein